MASFEQHTMFGFCGDYIILAPPVNDFQRSSADGGRGVGRLCTLGMRWLNSPASWWNSYPWQQQQRRRVMSRHKYTLKSAWRPTAYGGRRRQEKCNPKVCFSELLVNWWRTHGTRNRGEVVNSVWGTWCMKHLWLIQHSVARWGWKSEVCYWEPVFSVHRDNLCLVITHLKALK